MLKIAQQVRKVSNAATYCSNIKLYRVTTVTNQVPSSKMIPGIQNMKEIAHSRRATMIGRKYGMARDLDLATIQQGVYSILLLPFPDSSRFSLTISRKFPDQ